MALLIIAEFIQDMTNEEEIEERNLARFQFQQLRLARKHLHDTSNPFNVDVEYFRKHYRMTQDMVLQLINLLENHIVQERNSGIAPRLQVLNVLHFLAEGRFQKGFAQDFNHPISQSTASRCVIRVVNAINLLSRRFIRFPTTREERQHIQNNFQKTIRIPGIIGLVDGFLVTFRRPTQNEEAFYNYREGHSMNVQIIVDSNYVITNVRICPGRNNDRFIWQFSKAKQYMELLRTNGNIIQQEGHYYILGDSGYTPSPVLLTRILNAPEGSPEANYTSEHVSTRCQVERTIGILTNVWMAIKRARKLYYSVDKVAAIINACIVLHNFRRQYGNFDDDVDINENNNLTHPDNEEEIIRERDYRAGIVERNRLVQELYV